MAKKKDPPKEETPIPFWKLRSKHGRDKLFKTPALLWEAAVEYFQWCDDNPLQEEKAFHYQGEITKTSMPKLRAYTLGGFLLYVKASESYLRVFKHNLKGKTDKVSKDFLTVIRDIEQTIYNQKFTGASADLLNANIIARDLGLADKQEVTEVQEEPDYSNLSTKEKKQLHKLLKKSKDE